MEHAHKGITKSKDFRFSRTIGRAPGDVIGRLMSTYLREINLPEDEIRDAIDQIKGGNMNRLFEHFEGFDIQATRRESKAEGKAEGKEELLIEQVCKKIKKGKSVAEIATDLEEEETRIQAIVNVAEKYAPEYKVKEILKELLQPA